MAWKSTIGIPIQFKFQDPHLEGSEEYLLVEDKIHIIEFVDDYLKSNPHIQVVNLTVFGE